MRYRCYHRGSSRRKAGTECGRRVKLAKQIDQYVRRPMCPGCGRDSLRIDLGHYKRKRKLKCNCPGVHFPHERGAIMGCQHYSRPFTEDEYRSYLDGLKAASLTI